MPCARWGGALIVIVGQNLQQWEQKANRCFMGWLLKGTKMGNRKTPEEQKALGLELLAKQFELDKTEAGETALFNRKIVRGIEITSRWDILKEFELMESVACSISPLAAVRIKSIWCDSRCGSFFHLTARAGLYAPIVISEIGEALVRLNGGYNGVLVEEDSITGSPREVAFLDPEWGEDYDELLDDDLNDTEDYEVDF